MPVIPQRVTAEIDDDFVLFIIGMRNARDAESAHWPAWTAFNRRMRRSRGDVGIWHETYLIGEGRYESIYSGMPPTGLAKAARLLPATAAMERARDRVGAGKKAGG